MNKEDICKAFCGQISVNEVPAGMAVRSPFSSADGDQIGFYIVRTDGGTKYKLEDSGLLIPFIEASGTNLESGTRAREFQALLDEYEAVYDPDTMEVSSRDLAEHEVLGESVKFMALLLRLQDLQMLRTDVVESTFREDAKEAVGRLLGDFADIEFNAAPSPDLHDYTSDILVKAKNGGGSAAIYLGTNEARINEAVTAWLEGRWKKSPVKIIAMCETDKPPASQKAWRRAINRLDGVSFF